MTKGMWPALALVLLGGCGRDRFWYTDDVDFTFDFLTDAVTLALGVTPGDRLETPYVRGTTVRIFAHTRRDGRFEDWTLRSSDPAVFEVAASTWLGPDSEGMLAVDIHATGAGEADIELVDDRGDVRDAVPIEVAFPDRVELHAAGALFVDNPALDSLADAPQVLLGELATFQVRYFDGDRLLSGRSVLSLSAVGDVVTEVEQTYLSEDRDWLRVTPNTEGAHDIGILVDGDLVDTVTVHGVGPEAVDRVEILGQDETDAEDEEWLVVLAQAFDAANEPIYGVEYTWDVNGEGEAGEGDLYRYAFDGQAADDVTATFGEQTATATIHSGEGYVDSSNNIGCTTTTGSPVGALFAALAIGSRRRRRI